MALLLWALTPVAAGGQDRAEADAASGSVVEAGADRIRARVAEIRRRVPAVTVDGRSTDWAGVPRVGDRVGDAAGRPGLDIRSVAVVPTDQVVLVRVETVGPPSRADRAFWLDVDVTGSPRPELQLGLHPDGTHYLRSFRADGSPRALSRAPVPHAVDEVVEVAVPMDLLERVAEGRGPLRGPGARSWVRVTAFTWDRSGGGLVDFASAASYRVVPESYPLDPPLGPAAGSAAWDGGVPGEEAAAAVPLPVEGRWFVRQGAFGPASHGGVWAWDLTRVDEGMSLSAPPGSCRNADFFGWGAPVRAPASGRVLRSRGDLPDGSPCEVEEGPANEVLMELEPGLALLLAHLRQGSVGVSAGDGLEAGAVVGRVGSSGWSAGAHLHLALVRTRPPGGTLPLALEEVRVGLNPGPDDPWARELSRWVPREGFFVEAREGTGGR